MQHSVMLLPISPTRRATRQGADRTVSQSTPPPGPPVSNVTSNPVTRRTLTAAVPTVERGHWHAEQLRTLKQCHEPFAAFEGLDKIFFRSSSFTVAVRSLSDATQDSKFNQPVS